MVLAVRISQLSANTKSDLLFRYKRVCTVYALFCHATTPDGEERRGEPVPIPSLIPLLPPFPEPRI